MGNTKSRSKATKRQTQIQYLGDRYPFGDEEILRLYRCHNFLRRARHGRKSFLSDWAVFASTLPPYQDDDDEADDEIEVHPMTAEVRMQRARLMNFIEGRILPSGFGRRFERAVFLLRSDVVDNRGSSITDSPCSLRFLSEDSKKDSGCSPCCCRDNENGPTMEEKGELLDIVREEETDEVSFMRLEKFLEGTAECGRRGARSALTVLFKCCGRNSRGGYTSDAHFDVTTGPMNANNQFHQGEQNPTIMANANEVLDLGYSLALASAFLSAARKWGEDTINPEDFVPEDGSNNTAIEALSNSLLDYASKRGNRTGSSNPYGPYDLCLNGSEQTQSTQGSTVTDGATDNSLVSLQVFLEWAEIAAPMLSACLGTFMHHILFPDRPYPPSRTPFIFPNLKGTDSAFFRGPSSPLLFSFACMTPSLGGMWHRLYTSEVDGLSFNRLQNALLGYDGPTLLIIRATNGGVFGAFTASQWKESKDFYGNSDCFLYQLLPACGVYRPSGNGRNFMYCNSFSRSKGYDGLAHGIGFGGTNDQPRLFIAESFEGCIASSQDLTFDRGTLLPRGKDGGLQKYFDIEGLEVWGVGGDEVVSAALGARSQQREIVAANIRKARKVDKAAFLDDLQSGLIESKAFQHRDQVRGRADHDMDEEKRKNSYVYEK